MKKIYKPFSILCVICSIFLFSACERLDTNHEHLAEPLFFVVTNGSSIYSVYEFYVKKDCRLVKIELDVGLSTEIFWIGPEVRDKGEPGQYGGGSDFWSFGKNYFREMTDSELGGIRGMNPGESKYSDVFKINLKEGEWLVIYASAPVELSNFRFYLA
jgi:hypothetical protein